MIALLVFIAIAWAGGTAAGWYLRGYADHLDDDDRHARAYEHERDALARINRVRRPQA